MNDLKSHGKAGPRAERARGHGAAGLSLPGHFLDVRGLWLLCSDYVGVGGGVEIVNLV